MEKFRLKILTPQGTVLEREAAGLYLRGAEGELAVFARHIPFITPVRAGKCTVVTDDSDAGSPSKIKSDDGFNDIEGTIGKGILRVTSEEVLLLVRSWE